MKNVNMASSRLCWLLLLTFVSLSSLTSAYTCTQSYSVVSGATCDGICRRNSVSGYQLQKLNSGLDCSSLKVGQSLCLRSKEYDCTAVYTVAGGDTCYSIATAKGISSTQLSNDNPGLSCGSIYAGQVLCVSATTPGSSTTKATTTTRATSASSTSKASTASATAPATTAAACSNYSTVQSGDTCDKICARSKVSLYNLQALNSKTASFCSSLQAGAGVCVDGASNNCSRVHTVVSDQSCNDIASKYSTTFASLRALNPNIDSGCSNIYAGEVLCVKPRQAAPSWWQKCTSSYTVVLGDTCNKIAAKLSQTSTQLLGLNPGLSCSTLKVDQVICGFRPSATVCPKPVFIKSNDTCYNLAVKVGMSLPEWQSLNTFNNVSVQCNALPIGNIVCQQQGNASFPALSGSNPGSVPLCSTCDKTTSCCTKYSVCAPLWSDYCTRNNTCQSNCQGDSGVVVPPRPKKGVGYINDTSQWGTVPDVASGCTSCPKGTCCSGISSGFCAPSNSWYCQVANGCKSNCSGTPAPNYYVGFRLTNSSSFQYTFPAGDYSKSGGNPCGTCSGSKSIGGKDSQGQYCCNADVKCAPRGNSSSCYVGAGCLFNCLDFVYPSEDTNPNGNITTVVVQQPFANKTTIQTRDHGAVWPEPGGVRADDTVTQRSEVHSAAAETEGDAHLSDELPLPLFQLVDQDADGYITLDELESVAAISWGSPEAAYNARKALSLPDFVDFIHTLDRDGDEKISVSEFAGLRRPAKRKSRDACIDFKAKAETCQSKHVLSCAAYFSAVQATCRNGHDNLVQRCIENYACEDICSCIRSVEKAALSQMDLRSSDSKQSVNNQLQVIRGAPHRQDLGHHNAHHKRLLPFLLFGLAALLDTTLGPLLAGIGSTLLVVPIASVWRFTGVTFWDPNNGQPPPCSTYLFWSRSCGAILSGKSRTCDPVGTRVYGHSCWDHFRWGSQGCGFLDLGCRSLCVSINTAGCPCSFVNNYSVQSDTVYSVAPYSTTDTKSPAACSDLCNADSACVLFEIPPLAADHGSPQCLLKNSTGLAVTLTGSTAFIKKVAAGACPTTSYFPGTVLGDDWSLDNTAEFGRRDSVESDKEGAGPLARATFNPFALQIRQSGKVPSTFASPLGPNYATLALLLLWAYSRQQPNLIGDPIFEDFRERQANQNLVWPTHRFTNINVQNFPQVTNTNAGGWNWVEVTRRLVNAFRRFVSDGSELNSVPESSTAGSLDTRIVTPQLRTVLSNNRDQIRSLGTRTWLYRGSSRGARPPAPGVQVVQANNAAFFTTGGVGPLSLEAAFTMALQVAGVNFEEVNAAYQRAEGFVTGGSPAGDFTAHMVTGNIGQETTCIPATFGTDRRGNPRYLGEQRGMGRIVQMEGAADQGNGNGFYLTFNLDPDQPRSPDNNLLVFAVHTTDEEARVWFTDDNAMLQTPIFTTYDASANLPQDGSSRARRVVRTLAHAHVGVITQRALDSYVTTGAVDRSDRGFPSYDQIGSFHFFLNPEEAATDPRQQYRDAERSQQP